MSENLSAAPQHWVHRGRSDTTANANANSDACEWLCEWNCENFVLAAEFPCEWRFATKFANSDCECDGLVHSAPAEWNLREIFVFHTVFDVTFWWNFPSHTQTLENVARKTFTKISRQISRHLWQRKTEKIFTSALLQGSCSEKNPLEQARNKNMIEAAILKRVLDRDWILNRRRPLSKEPFLGNLIFCFCSAFFFVFDKTRT